ncbi:MAG: SPOR domain-containing protein [Candidatus Eiseniibacteriota bacterium]
MIPPDDRDSKHSSDAPDSGKPYLSPRLRDKLDDPGDDSDLDFLNRKPSPAGWIITAVVVLVAVGGIAYLVHNSQVKAKAEAAAAAAEAAKQRAAEVADSLAVVAHADSLAAAAIADSIAFTKLPKWKQRQILAKKAADAAKAAAAAGGTSAAAGGAAATTASPDTVAPPPVEQGPFGIDAGQFLDQAQADAKAAELKAATGLAAQVTTDGEGDAATYHVVLGKYSSRASAEAKASALLGKAMVAQAMVVKLPSAP